MYLPIVPFANPVTIEVTEADEIKNNVPVDKSKLSLLPDTKTILVP